MLIDVHTSDEMGNVYTLKEPLYYPEPGVKFSDDTPRLVVPVGFESDGASVPRMFWRLVFPPGDTQALRAAFLHDYIYRTHPAGWDRAKADDLFYDVLVADGVPKWRAWMAWAGVRLGGGSAWAGSTRGQMVGGRPAASLASGGSPDQGESTGEAGQPPRQTEADVRQGGEHADA